MRSKPFDDYLPERVMNDYVSLTFTENELIETYYYQNGESVEIG